MTAHHYVLDTNVLVQYIRGSSVWERIRDEYQLLTAKQRPRISVVTEGELRSLAAQWNWGERKLGQLEYSLSVFDRLPIESAEVIQAYAVIDSYCASIGHKMGKNDVWIAATVAATKGTLLTTDRDFDHLSPTYLSLNWIAPDTSAAPP